MRRSIVVMVLALTVSLAFCVSSSLAQQEQFAARRVVNKVPPEYPRAARDMNLGGTVKVEAVVASNGTVKSVEIRGGHPLLAVAAVGAVSKWKWEPAAHETREPVELKFNPR